MDPYQTSTRNFGPAKPNTLRPAVVTIVVENEGQPPIERIYNVTVKDRDAAITAGYKQLPRNEHTYSHVQSVVFLNN